MCLQGLAQTFSLCKETQNQRQTYAVPTDVLISLFTCLRQAQCHREPCLLGPNVDVNISCCSVEWETLVGVIMCSALLAEVVKFMKLIFDEI